MPLSMSSPTRYHSTIVNSGLCSGPAPRAKRVCDLVDGSRTGRQQPLHAELGRRLQPQTHPLLEPARIFDQRDRQRIEMPIDHAVSGQQWCLDFQKAAGRRRTAPDAATPHAAKVLPAGTGTEVRSRISHETVAACRVRAESYEMLRDGQPRTRSTYSPVRVSILITSPMLIKIGQGKSAPVSTLHWFADVRRRVAFGSRFAPLHLHFHMVGWRHRNRAAIE